MDRANYHNRRFHDIIKCLYAVVFFTTPVLAQESPVSNIAGPSASATGNVTNQAVQVLQGPFAVNTYGGGIQCQTSTLAISPFSIQGWSYPDAYTTNDVGVAATVSIPLDGGAVELCKEAARTQIARQQAEADKATLDYNLVRVLKCTEIIKAGAFLHPSSPYAGLCQDVIALGEDGHFRNGVGQVVRSAPDETSSHQDS